MNNRKMKKGIKMSFIRTAIENGDTKHDAKRLFIKLRKLGHLQKQEARRLGIPIEGAWWNKIDNDRLIALIN